MSKIILALGAAALAISAPALAQEKGGGNKGGGGGPQKAERGGGNPGGGNPGRGNGGGGGGQPKAERGNGGGGPMMRQGGGNRVNDQARGPDKARGNDRIEVARGNGRGNNDNARIVRDDRRDSRDPARDFGREDNVRVLARNFGVLGSNYDNCPPGLARKDNGCQPPGQARQYLGARLQQSFADSLVPYQYRRWYPDDNNYFYRYGDDYIYRINRQSDLIDGLIPLFGNAGYGYYALGDPWPSSYDFYNVPYQYRSFYGDTGDYRYRYGDGAIYRVNSGSGVVEAIVALLAGDLGVGSRLPIGYDTYNVPFAYRDRYYDSPDRWYRYNDGYIYQVDPKTRLISAVIDAIV